MQQNTATYDSELAWRGMVRADIERKEERLGGAVSTRSQSRSHMRKCSNPPCRDRQPDLLRYFDSVLPPNVSLDSVKTIALQRDDSPGCSICSPRADGNT